MAILFYKKKKREIYLGALVIALILVLAFLWFTLSDKNPEEISIKKPIFLEDKESKIQIDFEKLENQILQDLESFSPILSVPENLGREYPFAIDVGTSSPVLPEE